MTDHELTFVLNGTSATTRYDQSETLAEVLRERLSLTGTKVSCAIQVCGVCTVLVDDRAVSSCALLAGEVEGRSVTTIEGIGGGDQPLHRLQELFMEHSALQCGFCTPGFIMMTIGKIHAYRRGEVTEAELRSLDDNLCRCTGYIAIRHAVERYVAEIMTDAPELGLSS